MNSRAKEQLRAMIVAAEDAGHDRTADSCRIVLSTLESEPRASHDELELLACAFHGALTFGHLFAAFFNALKRRWWWVVFHVIGAILDARGVVAHARDIES